MSKHYLRIILLFFVSFFVLHPVVASAFEKADAVVVVKSEAKLYLKKNGKSIRAYDVRFGANPQGPKRRQGDERTPEGRYTLDYKNRNSSFYKSIHISYPNAEDRKRADSLHVDPGGDIMIHGLKNGEEEYAWLYERYNWTDGCIAALSNVEMDEIWQAVDVGTPIVILP